MRTSASSRARRPTILELAAALAGLADAYVDDAFGSAHRAHASTEGAARLFSDRAAGLLLVREVEALSGLLEDPSRPLVAVLGGAKVSDKIGVIESFMRVADTILIGGAMCFPFLAALGHTVGDSLCAADDVELARKEIADSEQARATLALPSDLVVADHFGADAVPRPLDGVDVPDGLMGLDIGERTADAYARIIRTAGTVFWNGPMGAFELEPFSAGTRAVARGRRGRARRDRRRRRRLGRGAGAVRARGRGNTPLDRRRSGARADRGTRATGSGGAAMRVPLIAGNWKMHKTIAEAEALIAALLPRVSSVQRTEIAICPPFTALQAMVDSTRGSRVAVYAQNMHQAAEGAYTGEVSRADARRDRGFRGVAGALRAARAVR